MLEEPWTVSGIMPPMVVSAVIMIGRKRRSAASSSASVRSWPPWRSRVT